MNHDVAAEISAPFELGLRATVQVDGNVSWQNIPEMVGAGADCLVLGTSSIFRQGTVEPRSIARVRALADAAWVAS